MGERGVGEVLWGWRRRAIAVAVCLLVPATAVASIVVGVRGERGAFEGVWWLAPGAVVAVVNFWLSFVRPPIVLWLNRRAGRGPEAYRFESGLPVVGTVLLLGGILISFGAVGTAAVALGLLLVDTCGLVWFLIMTWGDEEMWEGKSGRTSGSGEAVVGKVSGERGSGGICGRE